jgi:hypothetical protein
VIGFSEIRNLTNAGTLPSLLVASILVIQVPPRPAETNHDRFTCVQGLADLVKVSLVNGMACEVPLFKWPGTEDGTRPLKQWNAVRYSWRQSSLSFITGKGIATCQLLKLPLLPPLLPKAGGL